MSGMIHHHLLPVFALIGLGTLLRRRGLTDAAFLRTADRMIYQVFFPALLFWKIGGTPTGASLPVDLWLAGAGGIVALFLVSLLVIAAARVGRFQAGAFSQSTYRFNTYVAIAVTASVMGDAGVKRLGELLSVAIPLCNVLAVATLVWFSPREMDGAARLRQTVRGLATNPLILACAAGMLWSRVGPPLPVWVDNTFRLAASITLPLALVSIGGAMTLGGVRGHLPLSLAASALKCALLPVVGYGLLRAVGASPDDLLVGMLFFAMPSSTAMYVLCGQLDSDASLAGAVIAVSTAVSFVSLSAVLLLFAA
jgi:malonate transporter